MLTLYEGAAEERSKLDETISELHSLFVKDSAEATQRLADYKGEIAALKAKVNDLTDSLIALMNEQRREALAEIDAKAATPLQRLGSQKATVEKLVSRCHSCGLVAQRLQQQGSASEIYELSPVRTAFI